VEFFIGINTTEHNTYKICLPYPVYQLISKQRPTRDKMSTYIKRKIDADGQREMVKERHST